MDEKIAGCPLGAKCEEVKDVNGEQVLYRCPWHIKVRGVENNTGKHVDNYACAMAWMPVLLIENSNQQRGTGAAVESFRNEMVKANHVTTALLALNNNQKLIEGE